MSNNKLNKETDLIIAQNKEQWNRLLFLLKNPEDTSIFWINCDSELLKRPLHDALHEQLSQFSPYDITIDEKTISLKELLQVQSEQIPSRSIIHIFGMENATKNNEFIDTLNFNRDSLFRKTPANIIIWADFATGTLLARRAYDFWSWMVFSFDFHTPGELLTTRQRGFKHVIEVGDESITIKGKDSSERIRHLEFELENYLQSINQIPTSAKQMNDIATITLALVKEYRDEGENQKSIDCLKKISTYPNNLASNEDTLNIQSQLAYALMAIGDIDKSIETGENLLKNAFQLYNPADSRIGLYKNNLAVLYIEADRLIEAKDLLESAIENYSIHFSEDNPRMTTCQSSLAAVYKELGDYSRAKTLLEKVLEYELVSLGEKHPKISIRFSILGMVHSELGNFPEAVSLLEKALANDLINFGPNHVRVATRYNNLAYIFEAMGDYTNAKKYIIEAYAIVSKNLGSNHPKTKNTEAFLNDLKRR